MVSNNQGGCIDMGFAQMCDRFDFWWEAHPGFEITIVMLGFAMIMWMWGYAHTRGKQARLIHEIYKTVSRGDFPDWAKVELIKAGIESQAKIWSRK